MTSLTADDVDTKQKYDAFYEANSDFYKTALGFMRAYVADGAAVDISMSATASGGPCVGHMVEPIAAGEIAVSGGPGTSVYLDAPTASTTADVEMTGDVSVTIVGGTNAGLFHLNTTGAVRILDIANSGPITVSGGTDILIAHVTNAATGTVTVSGASQATMYKITNAAPVTVAGAAFTALDITNTGVVTITSGEVDIQFCSTSAAVTVAAGVTGTITAPAADLARITGAGIDDSGVTLSAATAGCGATGSNPAAVKTCADITANTGGPFDCSGHANNIHASPATITCAVQQCGCTAGECCTVVPPVTGMCKGNTDATAEPPISCSGAKPVEKPSGTAGRTTDACCDAPVTGMCKGNTDATAEPPISCNSTKPVEKPSGTAGRSFDACCEAAVTGKCTGNTAGASDVDCDIGTYSKGVIDGTNKTVCCEPAACTTAMFGAIEVGGAALASVSSSCALCAAAHGAAAPTMCVTAHVSASCTVAEFGALAASQTDCATTHANVCTGVPAACDGAADAPCTECLANASAALLSAGTVNQTCMACSIQWGAGTLGACVLKDFPLGMCTGNLDGAGDVDCSGEATKTENKGPTVAGTDVAACCKVPTTSTGTSTAGGTGDQLGVAARTVPGAALVLAVGVVAALAGDA